MIDTHCHLTDSQLAARLPQVIDEAHAAGVDRMVSIGSIAEDADHAAKIARDNEGVYYTLGLHPNDAATMQSPEALKQSLDQAITNDSSAKLVAVGEMGLDWHYPEPSSSVQRQAFAAQLELLADHPHLPAVIHNREATDETLAMIGQTSIAGNRFVFHCFTGEIDEVDRILEIGAMVGFTGIVTFKNADEVARASDRVPLDRLLIETDSPYCTPEPHRKVRPNEPRYVVHVAEFLAARRGMSVEAFTRAVDANAARFYRRLA